MSRFGLLQIKRILLATAVLAGCHVPDAKTALAPPPKTEPAAQPPALPPPPTLAPVTPPAPQVTGGLRFVGRHGDTFFRHGDLYSVGISRNAQFGATGGNDGIIGVWDLASGRTLQVIETGQGSIHSIAITDDGKWVATDQGNAVRLWDVTRGTQRWKTEEITSELRFAPDGTHIATARQIFDVADGRMVWKEPENTWWNRGYAISDDATVIAGLVDRGGSVSILGPDGKHLRTFAAGTTASQIAVSPKGDRVGVLDQTDLRVLSTTGRELADVPVAGIDRRQSPRVLLGDDPRYAIVWDSKVLVGVDVVDGREVWRVPRGRVNPPAGLVRADTLVMSDLDSCMARRVSDGTELWRRVDCETFAISASTLFFARARGVLELVDSITGKSRLGVAPPDGPIGRIAQIAFSSDGARFATLAWDDSLWVWDAKTATKRQLPHPPNSDLGNATMRFLDDGSLAVVTDIASMPRGFGHRYAVHRYDLDRNVIAGSRELALKESIAGFELDGDRVIVQELGETECPRTTFDLRDRAPPKRLPRWKDPLYHAIFREAWEPCNHQAIHVATRDGKRIYVAADGTIAAWDVAKARAVATHVEQVDQGIELTPDEKSLLVLRDRGPVVVLDARDLHELRRLEGPRGELASDTISSDSTLFASTTPDGLAVWRLADGVRIATVALPSKLEAVSAVELSPDGKVLWAGTTLGSVLEFRVEP